MHEFKRGTKARMFSFFFSIRYNWTGRTLENETISSSPGSLGYASFGFI